MDSCRLIRDPIKYAPTIPRIDPHAAPIRVLRVARRIRSSNRMIQTAINAPSDAEIHESPATGFRMYPAATKIAVNISRIRTTSACITRAYYHAHNPSSRTYLAFRGTFGLIRMWLSSSNLRSPCYRQTTTVKSVRHVDTKLDDNLPFGRVPILRCLHFSNSVGSISGDHCPPEIYRP